MKKYFQIALSLAFLAITSPAWAQDAQVTKVDPEKFEKLTPEQKERFVEVGKDAQRAAEASTEEYNEVEKEATEAKEVAEAIRDTAIDFEKKAVGLE
jgi:TRAP-type C4-dicarboxylate transport system substrate-binding protein